MNTNEQMRRALCEIANRPECEDCEGEKDNELCDACYKETIFSDIVKLARAALSLPPRNCDVGTAEEQQDRFNRFCRPCADGCPFLECRTIVECAIKWAQMPYEAEEGGADNYWRTADENEVQSGAAKWCMACSTDCPNKHTDSLVMCERFSEEAGK